MMEIKVLGPGCANCKRLEQITHKAVDGLAPEAKIIKVTDYKEIVDLGVMNTPGLIINGIVKSSGRVPSQDEVNTWVQEALNAK